MKEETTLETCHAAGLPEEEILFILNHIDRRLVKENIAIRCKRHPVLTVADRISYRKQIHEQLGQILGKRNFLEYEHDYCMITIMMAATYVGRNLEEISRISIIPKVFVDRVFARLDIERIWPVQIYDLPRLKSHDYKRIALICHDEKYLLKGYLIPHQ